MRPSGHASKLNSKIRLAYNVKLLKYCIMITNVKVIHTKDLIRLETNDHSC